MSHRLRAPSPNGSARDRRGSAYVALLGLSMLVTTIGMGAMLVVRTQRRTGQLLHDEGEARAASGAVVEAATRHLSANSAWRTTYSNDTYTSSRSFGRAGVMFKLVDPDNDLADDPLDLVRLYGAGHVGSAARVSSVVMAPTGPTLSALQTAAYSAGGLTLSGTSYANGGPVACAGGCTVNLLAVFDGDVECGSMLSLLGTVKGSVTTGAAARPMPSPTLFDAYSAIGTAIPYSSILSGSISKKVVTAASNPYGAANAAGVYTVDVPALSTLTITQSRLSATLVVNLGLSATLTISGATAWDPPATGMPTLIVKGGLTGTVNINGSVAPLSESAATTNFNPAGSPYFGSTNGTSTDTYPSEVRGLVHVVSAGVSTNFAASAVLRGSCISEGSISIAGGAVLIANPDLYTTPPGGYFTPTGLAVVPSTWRREQDD